MAKNGRNAARELCAHLEPSRRLLRAVASLHARGYERLRIAPGLSPSGTSWRCHLTDVTNVLATHGAWAHAWEDDGAHYTSGMGTAFFGWNDTEEDGPDALAEKLIARFPRLAGRAKGADPEYAAWYADMMRRTENGTLPCAHSDGGDEISLAATGVLASVGPLPDGPIPMPPPGACEPAEIASPYVPYTRMLTADWVGRTVVFQQARTRGEILASVTAELPPPCEGQAARYALRVYDGAREGTQAIVGASGIAHDHRGRVVRDAEHPIDALFAEMSTVAPYPEGTEPVWTRLPGTAFFPGGSGLWREPSGAVLPPLPHGKVMVVGQDFYTKKGYLDLFKTGQETSSPTWRPLRRLLADADFAESACFFTNAWMGLRMEEKKTGQYIGGKNRGFTERCAAYLAKQLSVQRPRVVVSLGSEVPRMLVQLAPALMAVWGQAFTFSDIDAANAGVVRDVVFPGAAGVTANVVALVHPSNRHFNLKHRRFIDCGGRRLEGHAAEVSMLVTALGALGADRW